MNRRHDPDTDAHVVAPLSARSHPNSNAAGRGAEDDVNLVAFAENQRGELVESAVASSLSVGGGRPGQGYPAMRDGTSVRRLTPLECERLQGFPDGWTDIDGASDTVRYAQLGNAVAVPVVEWLARRILAFAEEERTR